ncbi:conjugal transfer protein TraD, partial [Rhodococcus sp. DMU2021]|nr:conjugal transfer protein TraD [Rhodococcus sp. DMU2021]
ALVTIGGSTPILVRKAFWGNSPFAEAIRQSQQESKQLGPAQQKALPMGESDRPGSEGPQQPRVVDAPVVESSRTTALFTSEFMSKE